MPHLALCAAVFLLCGCPDGGTAVATSGTDGSGGSDTGGGPGGSTSDGGGEGCPPDSQGFNNDSASAFPLVFGPGGGQLSFEGRVCAGESDWFEVTPDCDGFFRTEVFCKDESGGDPSGPNSRCDQGRLDLYLWRDGGTELELVGESAHHALSRNFGVRVDHARVTPQRWLVEVRHRSGSATDYRINATLLNTGTCVSAAYLCRASTGLVATETSCATVGDSGGGCPTGSIVNSAAVLPRVDDGDGNQVEGLAVYVGPDELGYAHRPTTAETSLLAARCEDACWDHWGAHPNVTATCNASGAFLAPTLRSAPARPTIAAIPLARRDGSGIFPFNQLDCDLTRDCCTTEYFASDLCPARPERVTPGPELVGHGVQRRLALHTTKTRVDVTGSFGTESGTLSGTIGYTHARLSNASWPRPFYLGELELETNEPIVAELDCSDGTQQIRSIDALQVRLAQPAFGIARTGTSDVGFPVGALVFEVELTVDDVTIVATAITPNDVVGTATTDEVSLVGLSLPISVPCNSGVSPLVASLELFDGGGTPLDRPPEITFQLPSSVTCGSDVVLDADVVDADADLDTVRWYANGLLGPSVTQVPVTGLTVFEIRACDERGGCSWAHESVTCGDCTGSATPCSSYGSQASCQAQPGCNWSTTTNSCRSTRSCTSFDEADCHMADGCTWAAACSEVDEPCTSHADCCPGLACSDSSNECVILSF